MDRIMFRNINDFVLQVEEFNSIVDEIVIIGDYQWTTDVVNALIKNTVYTLASCNLHDVSFDGYDKEFLIMLADGTIWVERYYVGNQYLDISDDCEKAVMIGHGCSNYVLNLHKDDSIEIVIMEGNCDSCELKDECDIINEEELESNVPDDEQIKNIDLPNHNIDYYKQLPDGSEISISVYSNNDDLIKELAEVYLCEE